MCLRLDAASIAVPLGGRLGLRAYSAARLGEGQIHHAISVLCTRWVVWIVLAIFSA